MEPEDPLKSLAVSAARGDERSLAAVMLKLYPVVKKHIGFMLAFDRSTDDAVQESMLQIYLALPGYRGEASPKSWALRIASRTANRYIGKERKTRGEELPDLADNAPDIATQEWLELASILQILPVKKRQAMVLMGIMGFTAKEAATVMRTFPNTASSRFRLAREELQAHLEACEHSEPPRRVAAQGARS